MNILNRIILPFKNYHNKYAISVLNNNVALLSTCNNKRHEYRDKLNICDNNCISHNNKIPKSVHIHSYDVPIINKRTLANLYHNKVNNIVLPLSPTYIQYCNDLNILNNITNLINILIALICGMILAIIGDAILPSVSAKHHNKGNHSEKYNQMNFIADVVEDIAPSVVYIEIARLLFIIL